MNFRIRGLSPQPFRHLYGLADEQLAKLGVLRYIADSKPGFPDRVEMRDAEPGESLLLLQHVHQDSDTPYRASHAIFVREGAEETFDRIDEVPDVLRIRTLSLRGFDDAGMMVDADLVDGKNVEELISRLFVDPRVDYIQAHYAKRGCFAARIDRA